MKPVFDSILLLFDERAEFCDERVEQRMRLIFNCLWCRQNSCQVN